MIGNFLDIGILGFIGLIGGFALIQHFKGNLTLQCRCCRLWNYPRGVKLLDSLQARNHRRFQTRGCKYNEVVGKCRVVWFLSSEIQIEINKCGHQVGFTCTHGKAEQIIRVGYTIESICENLLIIDAFGGFLDLMFQLGRYLITSFIGQERVLQ